MKKEEKSFCCSSRNKRGFGMNTKLEEEKSFCCWARAGTALFSYCHRRWLVPAALVFSFIVPAAALADPPVITGFELTGGSRTLYNLPAHAEPPFPELPPPELAHTYACGNRWIRVFGENIAYAGPDGMPEGAAIKLTMAGAADIEATVHDLAWLTINPDRPDWFIGAVDAEIFVPEGQPGGLYSVVVTNPDGQSATLPDVLEVDGSCPRGRVGDLYVCNDHGRNDDATEHMQGCGIACGDCDPDCHHCICNHAGNVLQFDGQTGEFVCIFSAHHGMDTPADLTWGPNGNLFVVSLDQWTSLRRYGKIQEFDGQTGEFVRTFVFEFCGGMYLPRSVAFGGPDANLYVLTQSGHDWAVSLHNWDNVLEYDGRTGAFIRDVFHPQDDYELFDAQFIRFGPNGNILLSSSSACATYEPLLAEFEPITGDLVRALLYGPGGGTCKDYTGFVYERSTDSLLACNLMSNNIERVDWASGEIIEILVDHPGNPPPGLLENTWDLAFGPGGDLFVSGNHSSSPLHSDPLSYDLGAVHEFDPTTFEQVQFFGYAHNEEREWDRMPRPHELWQPRGMAFKPLPGDWGGDTAGGDWQVDIWDYDRFAEAFDGTSNNPANDLIAFDSDRDGDVDCDDWEAFQLAWTAGGSPPPVAACAGYDPDPDGDGVHTDDDVCPDTPAGVPVDAEGRPVADLDRNCAVDMADFGLFQLSMTGAL